MPNDLPDAPWVKDSLPDAPWASTPQEKPAPTMLTEAVAQKRQEAVQGIKRGIIGGLGLPGDITQFIGHGIGASDTDRALPTSQEIGQAAQKYLGIDLPKGKADKVVEFLANPASYLGGGGLLSKVLGAGTAGVGADIGERVGGTKGEFIGALTGGILPQGLAGRAPRLAVGLQTPVNREAATSFLRSKGIDVSAGQQTGSNVLRRAEVQAGSAPLAGDAANELFKRQMRQFTGAALREVGETATEANPAVIDRAFKRIGNDFDRLQSNVLVVDKRLKDEIAAANQDYINTTPLKVEYAQRIADEFGKLGTSIAMPGATYKALRTKINELMRKTTDPAYKDVLQDYQSAIDSAMERTLQKTNPGEVGKWREARRQYRNLLVIEKAATRAGEAAAEGIITPQSLRQAVVAQSRRSYGRGQGDFAELARAGNMLLIPPRSSGTAENLRAITLSGALAGLGGRALHSQTVQDILRNRTELPFRRGTMAPGVRALLNVLGEKNAMGSQ